MENLKNKIIISTRPLSEDDSIKDYLVEKGASVLDFPMIKIYPVTLTDEIKQLILHISDFQWLVFTSKNGVKYFFQLLNELNLGYDKLSEIKIAVVGKKTAAEVEKYHCLPHLISSGNNSIDLAIELANLVKPTDKVLLALATIANKALEQKLEKLCHLKRIDVYLTEEENGVSLDIIERIRKNDYHIIIFTSPSGYRHFSKIMTDSNITNQLRAACIGTTTEEEMLKNNFEPLFVSMRSEGLSFAMQLERYLDTIGL